MSGKVKLSIITLCLSALAVFAVLDICGMISDRFTEPVPAWCKVVDIPYDGGELNESNIVWTENEEGYVLLESTFTSVNPHSERGYFSLYGRQEAGWTGENTPDSISYTASMYMCLEGNEPKLWNTQNGKVECVKSLSVNINEVISTVLSQDRTDIEWVEVRLDTVFTFGDKEQIVNNAVRYER